MSYGYLKVTEVTYPGKFIVVDGGDGCGKTSVIPLIADELTCIYNKEVIMVKDPGTTMVGQDIRRLVLNNQLSDITELLLFLAAREELAQTVIIPALKAGAIVICDRYNISTRIYQGMLKGLTDVIDLIEPHIGDGLVPDLTLVLDVPVEIAAKRIAKRLDNNHYDDIDLDIKARMRTEYKELAMSGSLGVCAIIDATPDIPTVVTSCMQILQQQFN